MNLFNAQELVAEFHRRIGADIATQPRLLPCDKELARNQALGLTLFAAEVSQIGIAANDLLLQRLALALEELSEWVAAHADGDLIAAADAVADRLYLTIGDAVAAGFPAGQLFVEIHASNMTKRSAIAPDGKGVKGETYRPPDVAGVLKGERKTQPSPSAFVVVRQSYAEGQSDSIVTTCAVRFSKASAITTAEQLATGCLSEMINDGTLETDAARIEQVVDDGEVIGYAVWDGEWRDSAYVVHEVEDAELS